MFRRHLFAFRLDPVPLAADPQFAAFVDPLANPQQTRRAY